jgi:hypothetical protein
MSSNDYRGSGREAACGGGRLYNRFSFWSFGFARRERDPSEMHPIPNGEPRPIAQAVAR